DVVAALPEIVADVGARNSLERAVVELLEPRLVDETFEQIAHHLRMREQQLVGVIVIRHRPASLRNISRERKGTATAASRTREILPNALEFSAATPPAAERARRSPSGTR